MDKYQEFNNLILLIGTNPLPNFVVADYFLRINQNIQSIWLTYSEAKNMLQTGTDKQAKNLETLLRKLWEGKQCPSGKLARKTDQEMVSLEGEGIMPALAVMGKKH
ncbi:MAG: hypothetical protein AB1847_20415, partial [bacterium]